MTSIILNHDVSDLIRHRFLREKMENLYKELGLPIGSPPEVVKQQFRKLALVSSGQVQWRSGKKEIIPESGKGIQCLAIPRASHQEG